jgi:hypothetical protein
MRPGYSEPATAYATMRARSVVAQSVLRACSTISASISRVEQALSLCFERQLWRRADALICRRCLSHAVFAGVSFDLPIFAAGPSQRP